MIFDPTIEVTCDVCKDAILIEPSYVYSNRSGSSGYYDCDDAAIEKKLVARGWIIKDDKQFCSEDCANDR